MDTSTFQLDQIHQEVPALLCQYTYFLNKESQKVLSIGFDPSTFRPVLHLTSLVNDEHLCFSNEDWACVTACLKYCLKYLIGSSDVAWYSSNSLVIESIINNGERLIKITNLNVSPGVFELNLNELQVINQFSTFLTRILKHYSDYWFDVEYYYRSYLLKCISWNKKQLDISDYFTPGNRCLNYFRIFNEFPIVCRNKLEYDLLQK